MAMKILSPSEIDQIEFPYLRVLGLDPSMTNTGWSILNFTAYSNPDVLGYGNIKTSPTGEGSNMKDSLIRMNTIHEEMLRVRNFASIHLVDLVAIELPVPARSGAASQAGSMSCVAANIAVSELGVPIVYVHPTHSKKVTTGNGKADKATVKKTVIEWLGGREHLFDQNVADSMSASICTMLDLVTGRLKVDEERRIS